VVTVEVMQQGITTMPEVYYETLIKLLGANKKKRCGMLTYGVVLLHDNAHPHASTADRTRALLEHFNWELSDHPPYSPNLAPSDYPLFTYLKNWLGSQRFSKNEELKEGVRTWLRSQAADFFDTGIQKVISDTTSASIPAVTMLRSSLSMYVLFYVINSCFSLLVC
jgi:histone-lysine N-methyltransferase SETMAR